ncbi:hypothetical protein [Thermocrispum agreste]|uniref:hypothetical protein n=1 Tax=Thermocrispum agreste TaxID=37925 RepID=UPI0003F6DF9D|nr:hypothetical protein [Thermocrispum agreste]
MSWQEELRRLDADLAAGRLTKDQYVLRREELLAQASAAPGMPYTTASPASTAGNSAAPAAQQTPDNPNLIRPGRPPVPAHELLATNRPTTAPSPADFQPTEAIPFPPHVQAPGHAQSSTPTAPYQQPAADAVTQPAPPPAQQTEPHAVSPTGLGGPDGKRSAGESTKKPDTRLAQADDSGKPAKISMLVGLGAVVAILIGAALWWVNSTDRTAGQTSAAPPPAASTPSQTPTIAPSSTPQAGSADSGSTPSGLVDQLPQLPGVLNRNSGTYTPKQAADRNLFGADEAQLLQTHGVQSVTWKGSSRRAGDTDLSYVVLVAENSSREKAESTAAAMRQLSASRVPKVNGLPGYTGLATYRKTSDESSVYRVIYTSGNKTIRLGVAATPGGDDKLLEEEVTVLLDEITRTLPPNKG